MAEPTPQQLAKALTLDERMAKFGFDPSLNRGTLLPFGTNQQGENEWAVPQIGYDMVKALVLPGHVAQGGQATNNDVTDMALNLAGMGGSSSMALGKAAVGGPGGKVLGANVIPRKTVQVRPESNNMPTGSGGRSPLPSGVPGDGVPQPLLSYPPIAPPAWATDKVTGKEYLAKVNSPEALLVQKTVGAAQRDIDAGNYIPYFPVSQRADVDPSNYLFLGKTIDKAAPRTAASIEKYEALANDPSGLSRLRKAYEEGRTIPDADRWYFMKQLEDAFVKELGPEEGRRQFDQKFATSMAATTGGSSPKENLRMAMYGNYLRENNLPYPEHTYEMPYPIGGRYAKGNITQHEKIFDSGGAIDPAVNPKRHNFRGDFLGDTAATIDEQMSGLFQPGMQIPPGPSYGSYEGALNRIAAEYGLMPRDFQDVAWAGAKKAKEGAKYPGSSTMIKEVNEAIERTARVTGQTPEEVVTQNIIRSQGPVYMTGNPAMLAAGQNQDASPSKMALELAKRLSDQDFYAKGGI